MCKENQEKIKNLIFRLEEIHKKVTRILVEMQMKVAQTSEDLQQINEFLLTTVSSIKMEQPFVIPKCWMYFTLFKIIVEDIKDNEEESKYKYNLIYVKLMHGNRSPNDEEFFSRMNVTVLSVNKMQLLNVKNFNDKLNDSIDANIRKYD